MDRSRASWLVLAQLFGLGAFGFAASLPAASESPRIPERSDPAAAISQSLPSRALRALVDEVLERHPGLARARYRAVAAATRAPQVRALPDPVAALDVFLLPPETRVGPQRFRLALQQQLPYFGKLKLAEQAALLEAAAVELEVDAMRLKLVSETRRLVYEIGFLDAQEAILTEERASLENFEAAAQARYASGSGLQQESVRIQTQITRIDTLRLEVQERRASLLAAINTLRDKPGQEPVDSLIHEASFVGTFLDFKAQRLLNEAQNRRPELAAADLRIEAARRRTELARLNYRPDLKLELSYTAVDRRADRLGRDNPPAGNGDDILALGAAVNLPIRKRKLEAGVAEAQATTWAMEEQRREILAAIQGSIGDLTARMPLLYRHLNLLENVLLQQAREALRSAETAYHTGKLNAVDLLDAEVVLFDVRTTAARTRADLAVAWASLEREVARPLVIPTPDNSAEAEP